MPGLIARGLEVTSRPFDTPADEGERGGNVRWGDRGENLA